MHLDSRDRKLAAIEAYATAVAIDLVLIQEHGIRSTSHSPQIMIPNDPAYLLHIDPQSKPGLIWNPHRVTKLDTNTIAIKGTTVSPPDQLTGEARQWPEYIPISPC